MSITHLPDIGGLGFGAAATEIYHEGLRLPICKLARAGRLDETMLDVIRANVRVPEQVFGDLMANLSCNEVGARQLLEFMDEYGLDDLGPLSAAIRGQSERAIRDRIEALPDGVYEGTLDIEGIDDALRLACRAEVEGRGIALDFAGTLATRPPGHQRALLLHARHGLLCRQVPHRAGHAQQRRGGGAHPGQRAGRLHPERPAPLPHRRAPRDRAHGGPARVPHPRRRRPRPGPGGLRHDEHRDVPGHQPRWTADVHHLLLDRRVRRPPGSRRGGHHSRARPTCGRCRPRCGNR